MKLVSYLALQVHPWQPKSTIVYVKNKSNSIKTFYMCCKSTQTRCDMQNWITFPVASVAQLSLHQKNIMTRIHYKSSQNKNKNILYWIKSVER